MKYVLCMDKKRKAYSVLVGKRETKNHVKVFSTSGVPRNFFFEGGCSTNSVEDRGQREQGSGGGSGGSCNLVQEIAFHIVKVS